MESDLCFMKPIFVQDLRKISLKPSFLRVLRFYAFGTLRERGSFFRHLCVSSIVEMFRLNVYTIGYVLVLIIIGIFNSIEFCLYVDHIKIPL